MPPADDADLRAADRLTGLYDQMTAQLGRVIVGQADVLLPESCSRRSASR